MYRKQVATSSSIVDKEFESNPIDHSEGSQDKWQLGQEQTVVAQNRTRQILCVCIYIQRITAGVIQRKKFAALQIQINSVCVCIAT